MSRTKNTIKNMIYSWGSNICIIFLGFVSRTIFINTLGTTYLGINGLFTNILSVLSFTELGIGTAMNFSLYKPVAENDQQKIKLLMKLYKNAYRVIAGIITVLGLLILPILPYLAKDAGDVGNLSVYYLIFLFNTVITYFVSYKFSLLNANQKYYIYTNVDLIFRIITTAMQLVTLIVYKNFLVYLLTGAIAGCIEKIVVNYYLNKMYPYVKEKVDGKLSEEELQPIKKNIGALIFHKIGEVAVHQTDNIIISGFINVTTAGIISNYTLIINSISTFIGQVFNSAISSLGNLIATEDKGHQYEVFKRYNFLSFWLYGFCSICLLTLSSAFISMMWGSDKVIESIIVILMCLDFYMIGQRLAIINMKFAGGVFKEDRFLAIFQAITNLAVSIILVQIIGIVGVYIGTIVSGMLATIVKPIITYKKMFGISSKEYFKDYGKYFLVVFITGLIMYGIMKVLLLEPTILKFASMLILDLAIPNIIFFGVFYKTNEFKYYKGLVSQLINKLLKRKEKNFV